MPEGTSLQKARKDDRKEDDVEYGFVGIDSVGGGICGEHDGNGAFDASPA